MPERNDVIFGTPCWLDLTTSDLEGAKTFYGGLFGWDVEDMGEDYGHYNIVRKNGKQVGAMMGKMPGMENVPDMWTTYFATEDAAATLEKVRANGGTVLLEPMQVMQLGSMADATDVNGGAFGLWQPNEHRGYELWGEPGASAWFELSTRNFDAATRFYADVLGVEISEMEGPESAEAAAESEDFRYATIKVDGEQHAGIMDATDVLPEGVPDHWVIYFLGDPDEASTYIPANGGEILVEPTPSPWGRFIVAKDPTGAVFQVIG